MRRRRHHQTEEHPLLDAVEDWLRSPASRSADEEPDISSPRAATGQARDLTTNPDGSINPLNQEIGGQSSVALIAPDHPAVNKVARVTIRPGSSNSYGNTVRLLMADYLEPKDPAPPTEGLEYVHAFAVRFPAALNDGGFPRTGLLWELHNTAPYYNYSSGAALAPHAVLLRPNKVLANRCCAGPITPTGWSEWHPEDPILTNLKTDRWINVVHRLLLKADKTGFVETYGWYLGDPVPQTPQVNLRNVASAQSIPGLAPDKLYLEEGFYIDGASSTNRTDTIDHTLPRRFFGPTALQDAIAWINGGTTPPPSGNVPQSTTAPKISGEPVVDAQIQTDDGAWTNSPTGFKYQWQWKPGGTGEFMPVTGATSKTFQCSSTFVGSPVRCLVTAINASGQASAGSNEVVVRAEVIPPEPEPEPTPDGDYTVSGTATIEGQQVDLSLTLTRSDGS